MSDDQWLRGYFSLARPTENNGNRFAKLTKGITPGEISSRDQRRELARVNKRRERAERKAIAWQAAQQAKEKARKGKR